LFLQDLEGRVEIADRWNAAVFRSTLSKSGHTFSATSETDSRLACELPVTALLRITSSTGRNRPWTLNEETRTDRLRICWSRGEVPLAADSICQPWVCSDTHLWTALGRSRYLGGWEAAGQDFTRPLPRKYGTRKALPRQSRSSFGRP